MKPRERSEVPAEDRWDLSDLYASQEDWERDLARLKEFPDRIVRWKGRLDESPETLGSAIRELLDQLRLADKVRTYASLRSDQDLSDPMASDMVARQAASAAKLASARSFFLPEVMALPDEVMRSWMDSDALKPYRTWLEEQLRFKAHILSADEEKLLAMSREATRGFHNSFGKLSNVDMSQRLPEIELEDGRAKLTNANLVSLLESESRQQRERVFRGYYGELSGNLNTMASLLDGHVRSAVFYARARGFDSALHASLFGDRVPVELLDTLIETTTEHLPVLHRYYGLRRRIMGLKRLAMYDLYVPLVRPPKNSYSFEEALELVLEALAPLGEEYVELAGEGLRGGWIDKYENRGKRSGAYSDGCYDSPPYILHNFTGTLRSVFTLAHELGHSMHTLLSNRAQPYHTSDYRILVAEVASTTNEMLLLDHLLKSSPEQTKAYLLDHLVGDFRGTVFRQVMFTELERMLYERVESGAGLTSNYVGDIYMKLIEKYRGDTFAYDETDRMISTEWGRIPHLYYNFYTYKYATGMASAVHMSQMILSGGSETPESYLELLSSGCSKPPLELLGQAGVELTRPDTVRAAMGKMDEVVSELEDLLT
ncbi:oligoendopeptidase F [Candidatus Fermentibacteria bacterium]|nr:oligoendopeptidase F [Candidatus Fermentibacteria bacterium]